MSVPEVIVEHGTYRVDWGVPELMRVEIDHLRAERGGDVIGELSVYTLDNGSPARLHASRANLTSVRARSELARYIGERNKARGLDWQMILETAAVHVVDAYRRGDPPVLLRDLARPGPDRHLLPWALAEEMVVLFGDGGDGKSLFALATAAAIASGDDLMGTAPTAEVRVGYLDWEGSGADHRDRLERLCGPDMPAIVYVRCERPLVAEVDRLAKIVRDHDLGYLIVDSAAYACDGPPEAAEVAASFGRALRQLGLGSLVIAHVNRAGDDSRPFGSQFWHNNARATWNVKRSAEGGLDRLTIGLYNRKANSGPLSGALGFTFDFGPDTTTVQRTDIHDVTDLAERVPLRARLVHLLRTGGKPQTIVDLAEILEAPVDSVKKVVSRGEGRVFTKVPGEDGIYRIGLLEVRVA